MNSAVPRLSAAALVLVLAGTAGLQAVDSVGPQAAPAAPARGAQAPASNAALGYVAADVEFMSGMIPHHAQAVLIAGWAASHGARSDVRILCERIVVGQRDEIAMMQTWLRDRGEDVPAANATHMKMVMDGQSMDMLMPGMLTDEELKALDKARGPEWDRMFLAAMIKHHQGAITMVEALFKAYGAAQDQIVFRFASDVFADQSIEIDRMKQMLAEVPAGKGGKA